MTAKVAMIALAGTLTAIPIFGQASDAIPDVSGTWVNNTGKIIMTETDGKLHMQAFSGDRPVVDYTCAMDGKECAVKEMGRPEKVMVYFNGPKLVEIKERGKDAVKRRFTVAPDGKALQMEVIPLTGDEKPETLTFQRQAQANAKSE